MSNINIYNNNKYFGEYLTGLFEGDGYIWIPTISTLKKKKHNPRFTITFSKNNEKLALYIKKKLNNYGFLRYKVRENAIVLVISQIEGLIVVLQFLHSNLKTPKIRQVNDLILWLNNYKNYNIKLETLSKKSIKETAWLSGFVDADGCFYIRVSKAIKHKSRISFRFSIDQRLLDKYTGDNYYFIMDEIGQFFNKKVTKIMRNNIDYSYWNLTVTKLSDLKIIINYFDIFPLLGVKSLDYNDWKTGYFLYINRNRITTELLLSLKNLKNNMNSQRIFFDYLLN